MTAFARAREGATGHLFDKLLNGLRSAFGEEFIGGTTWLFATCGKYGLLVGATLLLVHAIVGAAVAYTLVPLGLGVAGAAALVILQYISGRLLTVLDRWHRSIRVRLGSSALPDSVALAGILFALVALVGFTVLGVQSGELWLILLGVASFMGAAFLGIVALNAEKMGMDVVSESGPAQEGLALGVFALKSMAVLTPVVFGSAVLLGSLQVLVAIAILSAAAVGGGQTDLGTQPAAASEDVDILDDETGTIQTAAVQPVNNGASEPVFDALVALAMLWTGTLFLLIGGLIPLAAYLLFMLGYVILAVIQAILVLPGRMHNPERDRSDTAG